MVKGNQDLNHSIDLDLVPSDYGDQQNCSRLLPGQVSAPAHSHWRGLIMTLYIHGPPQRTCSGLFFFFLDVLKVTPDRGWKQPGRAGGHLVNHQITHPTFSVIIVIQELLQLWS